MNKPVDNIQIALMTAVFPVCTPLFSQSFHYPKLMVVFFAAVVLLLTLLFKNELKLPVGPIVVSGGALILISWCSLGSSHAPLNTIPHCMLFLSAAIICFTVANFDDKAKRTLLSVLFIIAVTESLLAFAQAAGIGIIPGILLVKGGPRVIGTIGNSDFLAAFLGVSIFIGLTMAKKECRYRKLIYTGISVVFIAVVLTRSKGTVLFLLIWFLFWLTKKKWLAAAAFLILFIVAVLFYPFQFKGRLLLWLSSLVTFKENILFGVGIRQLGHHYLDSIGYLFDTWPVLKAAFGQNVGAVLDAHNCVLNFSVETGILGCGLSLMFLYSVFRGRKNMEPFLGYGLLLLLFRSTYTVMHNSSTTLILFALLVGISLPVTTVAVTWQKRVVHVVIFVVALCGASYSLYVLSADYWYKKGMKAIAIADVNKGRECIQKALLRNPQSGDAHLALGHIYFLQHDTVNIKPPLYKAITCFKTMNSLKISAHMLFYLGMYDDAEKLYREIERCYPNHLTTLAKLSEIYFKAEKLELAHQYASRLLDCKPRVKNRSDYRNRMTAAEIINITGPLLYQRETPHDD